MVIIRLKRLAGDSNHARLGLGDGFSLNKLKAAPVTGPGVKNVGLTIA